jgi:soluble lytic murein transglycosylase
MLSALFVTVIGCSGSTKATVSSAEAGMESERETASSPKSTPTRANLVSAGRALEAGDLTTARDLAKSVKETKDTRLLLARIARAEGHLEKAIGLYRRLAGAHPDLETIRVSELAETLYAAEKKAEAVTELKGLLQANNSISQKEHQAVMAKMASWLLEIGQTDKAITIYRTALSHAPTDLEAERINLKLGRALFAAQQSLEATTILSPLALRASKAKWMTRALVLLTENDQPPKWDAAQRLARARTLVAYRDWDNAVDMLQPLLNQKDRLVRAEASWLNAQILFNRRRHYQEAITALKPIANGGGPYAEEAGFLIARALSRLNRDPESIKAHLAFARTTNDKVKAAKATFHAGRLKFYLGNHKSALGLFENLVGTGEKKNRKGRLSASDTRDAHFMAGLCAFLLTMPKSAEHHFLAASQKTRNQNVLARNRYWTAVAQVSGGKPSGFDLLRDICQDDPTTWYARLAARRLSDAKQTSGPCTLSRAKTAKGSGTPVKPLDALSSLAAFLARSGFYREAAKVLKGVEDSKTVEATARDWVTNYNALDAPQYAVRRASIGLKWPAKPEENWRIAAAYPSPYKKLVQETEDKHSLPTSLIYAIARKESLFDPYALSWVGAMGLMQMMPRTYNANRKKAGLPALEKDQLPGPEASIQAAGFELAALLERFDGSLPLAIMAYNGGGAAVSRWLERSGDLPLDIFVEKSGFAQTRNYVKRVYKNLNCYRQLEDLPLPTLPRTAARPKNK